MKRYAQNFRKIYQFAEYGDNENFFIELCYVCPRSEFKSELGAPLVNKTAINGKPIFGNVNIELGKYRLLNERIEELEGDNASPLIKVFETYGFAPDAAYYTYSAEPISVPGIEDRSAAVTVTITPPVSYDTQVFDGTKLKMLLSDSSAFAVGDKVVIRRPYATSGASVQYALNSPEIPIVYKYPNSTYVAVPDFQFVVSSSGTPVSGRAADFINTAYGVCTISKSASTRAPSSQIGAIRNIITFHTDFPQPDSRLVISNGINEVDTITSSTTPDVATWKSWIADGSYVNVQDSDVEVIFPKTFYRKRLKQTLAR